MSKRRPRPYPLLALALALAALVASAPAVATRADDGKKTIDELEAARLRVVQKVFPAVAAIASGGSGVIIDPAGYVLTNFHVSNVAPEQGVGLPDGKQYKGRLVGVDPTGDIALIKLEGPGPWPYVELGSSDALRPGDHVWAMGNPFVLADDFRPTVTEGVVSAVHRFKQGAGPADLVYGDCIQIDAAINPGNSGGPLFDAQGRLVGINGLGGFRPERGRVFVGVGYAASIDQIKNFLSDLRAGKVCEHGTMDATVADRTDPTDPQRTRVIVDAVFRDSPAFEAGLRLGDVVLALDGQKVTTQNGFLTRLTRLPAGRRIHLLVWRYDSDGTHTEHHIRFRLAALPSSVPPGGFVRDADIARAELQLRLTRLRSFLGLEGAEELPDGQRATIAWRGVRAPLAAEGTAQPGEAETVETITDGRRLIRRTSAGLWGGFDGKTAVAREGKDDAPAAVVDEIRLLAAAEKALADTLAPDAEGRLAGLDFTGGDLVGGRLCDRIEAVDHAGNRFAFYLDPEDGALRGLRYRSPARAEAETIVLFDDFRRTLGRNRPHRMTVEVNGWPEAVIGGIEYRALDALDAGAWKEPAASALAPLGAPDAALAKRLRAEHADRFAARWAPAAPEPITPSYAGVIAPAMEGTVKIYGAGGFRGIPGHATGVIVGTDGKILTAWSVMLDTERLKVVLHDGRRFTAKLERRDTDLGLALLDIDAHGLAPLDLHEESSPRPGELVLTIGNAFGDAVGDERPAVAKGIVTAVGPVRLRAGERDTDPRPVLIIDAPGNPGTQGGPVLDARGRWIGVAGKVVENRETNEETSWAIPASHVRAFLDDRPLRGGRGEPGKGGWLGARLLDLSLDRSPPAYVDRVDEGSPAQKAGLRPDDLIFQLDDQTVPSCEALEKMLRQRKAGDRVVIHAKRGREVVRCEATLGEPPAPPPVRREEPPAPPGEGEKKDPPKDDDDEDGGGR